MKLASNLKKTQRKREGLGRIGDRYNYFLFWVYIYSIKFLRKIEEEVIQQKMAKNIEKDNEHKIMEVKVEELFLE